MKKIVIILIAAICLSLASCGVTPDDSGNNDKVYKVELVTNGGTECSALETSALPQAPETSREGYIFCGWYLDGALENAVAYPLKLSKDTTLYAKWCKATESLSFEGAAVQFDTDNDYSYKAEYNITPKELDLKALAALGYNVKIEVSYEVYYEKDYNVAFDLGYMGAPDHDVAIFDLYDEGEEWTDRETKLEPKAESVSTVISASKLSSSQMRLLLMTYNIQNIVYFKNINVTYTCQKNA